MTNKEFYDIVEKIPEVRAYSGRGMYGADTFAVENPQHLNKLSAAFKKAGITIKKTHKLLQDNMGLGIIYYYNIPIFFDKEPA